MRKLPILSGVKSLRNRSIDAAIVFLISVGTIAPLSSTAQAQPSSWEIACAQKVVSPGNGDILREMNCTRQKDCQAEANRRGATFTGNGCFGVAPSASYSQAPASR